MNPDAHERLQALMGKVKPPGTPPPRATPERSHVRTLVLIAVIAVLVAGGYVWLARPRLREPAAPVASATLTRPTVSAAPAGAAPAATASVVVHVLGKVKRPGVVTLPAGSRVAEAIKAAGGVRSGAKTGTLNLARRLVDGEQIPVGVPRPPQQAATSAASPGPSPAASGAPLDLNTATADQLVDLPGVGPVLAQRIVAYRTEHGGFRSVEQLQEVSGIGARRFADLKPMVRA
ncbi:competence protein ComEA [Actinomadura meyerae]|uniref:Competence protein ComEA n=1 Tax=Actinomadura meyerae TaxID=240840 RepID=A0A239BTI1_9ACTN|nr:ComEA family DNA-binding protein [Actinomadura meyerae]SNS11327.1 competence protein ComEA [Actinomadura meyerae]